VRSALVKRGTSDYGQQGAGGDFKGVSVPAAEEDCNEKAPRLRERLLLGEGLLGEAPVVPSLSVGDNLKG